APVVFYPFGSVAGDTVNISVEDENSTLVDLWRPFVFFGSTYNKTYVNSNGYLTFNQSSSEFFIQKFPINGSEDIIAPLWTDIDVSRNGIISYQQYSNGSVLTQVTQDINQYFPDLSFTATWVLVATWDRVEYFYHTGTAGYDTINSTAYFVIPGSINGSVIPNLMNSSNVNVPGRWAFRVDGGPHQNNLQENIIGVQMRVTSFSDLTENGNIEIVLEKLQQELVEFGLPSSVKLNLRKIQKTQP
ncbi:Sushi, nidogen and EGF-like domain-containing protein 1, partial [Anabarilius grahami]